MCTKKCSEKKCLYDGHDKYKQR
ncbi:hypothetical protein HYN49_07630 [Flavobacterium pallidum]|uniref:LNR domain-containing protein n=1 Tax=Flavobacterium pallidum TaxID=2172098 RepID=A0A2S1SLE1_9FLAO|nr:hypothetical protein HYN49_07630 [Flavobacterium pallidum]